MGWLIALLLILIGVGLAATATLCLAGRCDHTPYPTLHAGSSRIFYACRCGKVFQR